ncbi:hypothetical protein D0Z07_3150 [Hyphodiscus hymeniophilus]|uniref:Uncharacterized protein n=1 Tax=Hyphodiscus hymeniophilus TaxID=353542 RepID=A0A9P6VMU4_9HELO|nr:hypothetical protein D0Z07_3150 [Hyphodiscus hymeniophilus]
MDSVPTSGQWKTGQRRGDTGKAPNIDIQGLTPHLEWVDEAIDKVAISTEQHEAEKLSVVGSLKSPRRKKPKSPVANLYRGPIIGLRDPFDSLPVDSSGLIHKLLDNCCTVPNPREKWLPLAVFDKAFFNATLFVSALNICGIQGIPVSSDVFFFKGETIRVINERFEYSNKYVSDGTIAAVASLAQLENMSGSSEAAKIHMDGLEAMVKSRGGLQALGSFGIPRRQAAWSDACAAIVLGTKPRFELAASLDDEDPAEWFPTRDYRDILGLRNLSILKDEGLNLLVSRVDIVPYSDMVQRLEYRLVAIIQADDLRVPSQDLVIYTLFAHAAVVHISMFLRDLAKNLPFFYLLSLRIRNILEKVDISKLKTEYPEIMLWVFTIAGLCGSPESERAWFATLVADFCIELGFYGVHEIGVFLSNFFWSELYRSPTTTGFWKEVALAQRLQGRYDTRRISDHISLAIFNVSEEIE